VPGGALGAAAARRTLTDASAIGGERDREHGEGDLEGFMALSLRRGIALAAVTAAVVTGLAGCSSAPVPADFAPPRVRALREIRERAGPIVDPIERHGPSGAAVDGNA
jgi:hypothetical protein